MSDFTVSYDSCMEAARLASSRGDRFGAEQALTAAITAAGSGGTSDVMRAAALIKLGELKRDAGSLAEAEEVFGRALELSEASRGQDDTGLVSALTNLAAIRTARGAPEEAEILLTKALALTERRLGRDHPDLVVLVNDLSRLYLKRSAFALAEPLLLRLHAIKRVKGEEHPEVATVLASLATVREALGDHDAAEQLWRRVLAIRERTLAPNHFAIATAVEHLAETCSARGKVAEALRLFHRALAMREMTLGAAHPSLRVSRERIADLQLQGAEEYAAEDDGAPGTPTEWRIPTLKDSPAADAPARAPSPVARAAAVEPPAAPVRAPAVIPAVVVAEPAMRELAHELSARAPQPAAQAVLPEPIVVAPPVAYAQPAAPELEIPSWARREHGVPAMAVSRVDHPMSIILPAAAEPRLDDDDDFDLANGYDVADNRVQNMVASLGGLFRQRQTQAVVAGAVAVTLLVVAGARASQPRSPSDESSVVRTAPAQQYVAGGVTALSDSVGASLPIAKSGSRPSGNSGPSSATSVAPERPRPEPSPADRTPAKAAEPESPAPTRLPSIGDFSRTMSGVSTAQLDSAMRAAGSSRVAITTAPVVTQSFASSDKALGTVDYGSGNTKQSPAILIGAIPRVPYPQNLRAKGRETGGEVLVEFVVDTLGQPDMGSVSVVHSDHELFTAAVRRVIPSMRFVAAQNLGKKAPGKVQIPFYFAVARK